jgi:hypothetical protein
MVDQPFPEGLAGLRVLDRLFEADAREAAGLDGTTA